MPWWGIAYLGVITVISVLSAVADRHGRQRPGWHITLDVLAAGLLIVFIAGRWHPQPVASLGRSLAFIFILMLVWDVYSVSRDLADIAPDPELSPRTNVWIERTSILIGALLMAPGYALALMTVVAAWQGAA